MSILSAECPACSSLVHVPVAALLATTASADGAGRLAYICPACERFVDERLSAAGLVMLRSGGCELIDVPAIPDHS